MAKNNTNLLSYSSGRSGVQNGFCWAGIKVSAGHAPFGGSRRFCRPALFTSRGLLHSLLLGFFLRGTFGSWALTPLLPSSHLWAPQTIRDHSPSPDLLTSSHLQSPFCHMRYRPHRLGCRHLQRAIILSTLGLFSWSPFASTVTTST